MAYKPSVPKGTRDFSPDVLAKRNHIFNTIREIYERYGFMPIETPSMENLDTLTGKYGNEGDKLLFKVLNSGDYLKDVPEETFLSRDSQKISPMIAEKGLRYDLTVPFARYVVQHRNDIIMPFKRYQIQPVWRADRPQKGRYREFFQCDADIIGSESLINETELILIIDDVFSKLGINVKIRVNNRKILMGMAEASGLASKFYDFTIALDKLDKTGPERVLEELESIGASESSIKKLESIFGAKAGNEANLDSISEFIADSETGIQGIAEMRQILRYHKETGTSNMLIADTTLARGLNYYTGTIFEVIASDLAFGSLCGGGRYDDLTGIFGLPGLSGVGISFGADRIYDVMNELKLFADTDSVHPNLLFVNFGGDEELYSLKALTKLRSEKISAEIYPDPVKIKKQMSYASSRNIPYVVIAGEEERNSNNFNLKVMETGVQLKVTFSELIDFITKQ